LELRANIHPHVWPEQGAFAPDYGGDRRRDIFLRCAGRRIDKRRASLFIERNLAASDSELTGVAFGRLRCSGNPRGNQFASVVAPASQLLLDF